ncbi:MAG TPA: DNA repair exonuclease [Gemmatimonadales bacterium]|nr:DNA repair exonuclease [Gemmatimonadales bacterium]
MKLAHLADLHLGFRQFDRQTAKGINQREADVAEVFRRAVDDLLEQKPQLIVIAGDLFHSVRPTNAAIMFCFRQLHRLRAGLPQTPIVVIAGEHDTPRSTETGAILRLYEALGVEVAVEAARRIVIPTLDCAVLAVPHQALVNADRPALRPEPGGPTLNVLLTHGVHGGLGEERGTMEYGGAALSREILAPEKWDYIALGHYHTAQSIADNAWYSGSLEYLPPNPWGQLQDEAQLKKPKRGGGGAGGGGKGYLLIELPGARVTFRPIAPLRRHIDLPFIQGAGLNAKALDEQIAHRVASAKIDDQIVRLLVWDVDRAMARDLDHAAIRAYKARALNFQLDLRRPEAQRIPGASASGPGARRQTLAETVRDFLGRRPLDAELNRETFVKLGGDYLETAARSEDAAGGGTPA